MSQSVASNSIPHDLKRSQRPNQASGGQNQIRAEEHDLLRFAHLVFANFQVIKDEVQRKTEHLKHTDTMVK